MGPKQNHCTTTAFSLDPKQNQCKTSAFLFDPKQKQCEASAFCLDPQQNQCKTNDFHWTLTKTTVKPVLVLSGKHSFVWEPMKQNARKTHALTWRRDASRRLAIGWSKTYDVVITLVHNYCFFFRSAPGYFGGFSPSAVTPCCRWTQSKTIVNQNCFFTP